jgi:signal transduction histidine kinase
MYLEVDRCTLTSLAAVWSRSAGLRLLSLVNDILDAAALQHRRLVLAWTRVVLRPLVEEVADISRPLVGRVRGGDSGVRRSQAYGIAVQQMHHNYIFDVVTLFFANKASAAAAHRCVMFQFMLPNASQRASQQPAVGRDPPAATKPGG